jgi:hypothetical protein
MMRTSLSLFFKSLKTSFNKTIRSW